MASLRLRRAALAALILAMLMVGSGWAQTLTIYPAAATLPVGSERQLAAYLNGAASAAVTWAVNGHPGGNSTVGTISPSGKYKAPDSPPAGWVVTVSATALGGAAVSASSLLTVRHQIPWPSTVSPNPAGLGAFTLQVAGSRFVNGAQVFWNGTPLATTYHSATLLSAVATASQTGSVGITVANPGPGAVSAALTLKVTAPTATRTATASPTPTSTPTVAIVVAPAAASLPLKATQQFQATVSGAPLTLVWKVNNIPGGDPGIGTISNTGLYTAPAALPLAARVTVSAASSSNAAILATAGVSLSDPWAITHGRFLEQTTFGATPQLRAHLAEVGIAAFLDEQFAAAESSWPPASSASRSEAIDAFFGNALYGEDQLRQRVLYALSEILVIALNKNTNGNEIVPWLQLLSRNAFGNYRTLLRELTLDASMGKFLDLANSSGGGAAMGMAGGSAANENYPREIMQLFSIGLYQLNIDGSVQVDAQGVPLPTYTQADVQQLARALTGWTYGNPSNVPPLYGNYAYYPGPMLPVASRHNTAAKVILGQSLAMGQSIDADLDGAIDILFNHPNVGPFLATRLIRALVTSNPSGAYVARVASVFNDNGSGERGDLEAVVRAIVLDAAARNDNPGATFGRLRTPMQHTIALARALNLPLGPASGFAYLFYNMNEGLLDAPSVFGHYSPSYRIPKTNLFGPEFQIYSASDAVNRGNLFYSLLYNPWPLNPALQALLPLAANPPALVDAADKALLMGRMSASTRNAILNAMVAMPSDHARVLTAMYLTAMSGEDLVQR